MKMKFLIIGVVLLLLSNISVSAINLSNETERIFLKISDSPCDYILITSDEFASYSGENSFQDLIDYHNNNGHTAQIVTTEHIDLNFPGESLNEKIKNYIKELRPKYVLLGGDIDTIPGNYIRATNGVFKDIGYPVSDLYYSCPDVTWGKPEIFIPEDKSLTVNEPELPAFTLSGGGFMQDDVEYDEEYMKWTYREGSYDQYGYCNITFDEPIDSSQMRWNYLDILTNLKEYNEWEEKYPGIFVNVFGIKWNSFKLKVKYSEDEWISIRNLDINLFWNYVNQGDWEHFNCSFTKDKIYAISIKIRRVFERWTKEEDIPLNPGDFVKIRNLYFSDFHSEKLDKKEGDLNPSICLGRACVDNINDIQNFTSKTLRYLNTGLNNNYLKNALLIDVEDDGKYLDKLERRYLSIGQYEYSSQKFYDSDSSGLEEAKNILYNTDNNENTNIHIMLHTGHGTSSGETDFIYNSDIKNFKNINTFFEFSAGCSLGRFNTGNCYAESLTVKTAYGAFAGIYHTGTNWDSYFQDSSDLFLKAAFKWDYTIGEALRYVIQNTGNTGRVSIALFGDPAINLKYNNNAPKAPSAPVGTIEGNVDNKYTYVTSVEAPVDPDFDQYQFGWDFNGDLVVDVWSELGNDLTESYQKSWDEPGNYEVRVLIKDEHGAKSDWSEPLTVEMPRSKPLFEILFERLGEIFPNIFQLFESFFAHSITNFNGVN